jgi:uncharacterized protein YcfJ
MRSARSGQLLAVGGVLLLVAAGAANAGHRNQGRYAPARYDTGATIVYARVSSVQPLIEQVRTEVPVRECYETTAYAPPAYGSPRPRSAVGGTIVGGVIGGVVGDRFGRGEGRDAMRLLGALVGAAVGHDAASRRQAAYYPQAASQPYPVTECTTRYETRIEERTRGYRVGYVYEGREYYTETATPPGDSVPIEVSVRPAF